MIEKIIVTKADTILTDSNKEIKTPIILIQDPLLEKKIFTFEHFISVAFHDIVPKYLRPLELSGLTPFDLKMAEQIIAFTDELFISKENFDLIVACPHGRARGNSISEGIRRLYGIETIIGSVFKETLNPFVIDTIMQLGIRKHGVHYNVV